MFKSFLVLTWLGTKLDEIYDIQKPFSDRKGNNFYIFFFESLEKGKRTMYIQTSN